MSNTRREPCFCGTTEEFWNVFVGPRGPARAWQLLEEALKKDPRVSRFPKSAINLYVYEKLHKGAVKEANEIFKS